ncbi:hypothetical protein J4434_08760 [Candidatus Woesearchaeota archaeon]|nr:hypothetical protein [Candidatus Woesearchaeota archaeon]
MNKIKRIKYDEIKMEQETHKRAAEMHYEIAVKHHNLFISAISTEKKANMFKRKI